MKLVPIRAQNWHFAFFQKNSCFRGNQVKRSNLGQKLGFSEISPERFIRFFLIFCMVLDTNKGCSAMYMVYYRKLLFPWKPGQKVKFGPKIRFFGNFSRTLHYIFLIFCMVLDTNKGVLQCIWYITENSCFHGNQVKRSNLGQKSSFFGNFSRERFIRFFWFSAWLLDTNKGCSAMYMVYYRKLLFPWKPGPKVKFGRKSGFSGNFSRTLD